MKHLRFYSIVGLAVLALCVGMHPAEAQNPFLTDPSISATYSSDGTSDSVTWNGGTPDVANGWVLDWANVYANYEYYYSDHSDTDQVGQQSIDSAPSGSCSGINDCTDAGNDEPAHSMTWWYATTQFMMEVHCHNVNTMVNYYGYFFANGPSSQFVIAH